VSEASKRDILHFFNVAPEKIVVVYNAIDDHFWLTPPEEEISRTKERYQLDHQFVLYVGNIKPHKNLVRLIEAFDELRRTGFEDLQLLIIGDEISKLPSLRRAVHGHKLHKHVRFLGYVSDDTLRALYRLASVFVFPSLYEGFGLPPLEAMAAGVPVVAYDTAVAREVYDTAAALVPVGHVDAVTDALLAFARDPRRRDAHREAGRRQVARFDWTRTARATLAALREAAA
jgi:glycosyltransferase involved in cell wall biosynthesis